MYAQLNLDNGRKVLTNPFIFLSRRLWLAVLIVYGQQILILQISQVFLMTLLVALANYQFEVFKRADVRKNETFNETIVLLVSYTFIIFNVVTIEQNFMIGYVSMGITSLYMGMSLLIMLYNSCVESKERMRRKVAMQKYKKVRAQLQERLRKNHAKLRFKLE